MKGAHDYKTTEMLDVLNGEVVTAFMLAERDTIIALVPRIYTGILATMCQWLSMTRGTKCLT